VLDSHKITFFPQRNVLLLRDRSGVNTLKVENGQIMTNDFGLAETDEGGTMQRVTGTPFRIDLTRSATAGTVQIECMTTGTALILGTGDRGLGTVERLAGRGG